ncbi:MAG: metal ABC transporter permease [Candidatus Dormiibacterota bacterium]
MFSDLMLNAWGSASIVAIVAGVVGFFIVLRGSAFAAHALPNGAFAGAAGASLIGVDAIVGLAVFSVLGALTIAGLGRRARHDVATALVIVVMLGLGSLFLSMTTEYAPEIYSLLFGEVLGVSSSELVPIAVIGVICIVAVFLVYRPLMFSSVMPDVAEARGVGSGRMEVVFLLVVALTTTMAVPVVGALLIFSLLISPAAAARSFTDRPFTAMGLSVLIALGTVWSAIALAYLTNLPIGFFVCSIGAGTYAVGRGWAAWRRNRRSSPRIGATRPRPARVQGS